MSKSKRNKRNMSDNDRKHSNKQLKSVLDKFQTFETKNIELKRHGKYLSLHNRTTDEECKQKRVELRNSCETQKQCIKDEASCIERILGKYDTFDILAYLNYFETASDPETFKEWDHEGLSVAVEYAALLALKKPYNSIQDKSPINLRAVKDLSAKIHDTLQRTVIYYLSNGEIDSNTSNNTLEELRLRSLTSHLLIRNHSYPHHLKNILTGIFEGTSDWIQKSLGFELRDAFKIDETITRSYFAKLVDRKKLVLKEKPSLEEFFHEIRNGDRKTSAKEIPFSFVSELSESETKNYISNMCTAITFDSIGETCSFTIADIVNLTKIPSERVQAFFELFSISCGEVSDDFFLLSPTHELRSKPYISHNGRYLRVSHDFLEIIQSRIESLLNPNRETSINKKTKVWQKYVDSRAYFVETKAISLISKMMPNAVVEHDIQYNFMDNEQQVNAQLDGLILFDNNLLLIEVKAGSVDNATRRGAPAKLTRDMKKLIGEADFQATRAHNYIINNDHPVFIRRDGSNLDLNKQNIDKIFKICVTLDYMDTFMTMLYEAVDIGIMTKKNLPWAVNLRDLFVISEMIEFPSQFIHYLMRRKQLNELEFIKANDELDWFGHYLKEGLCFDDISANLKSRNYSGLTLLTYTEQFDSYYASKLGIRKKTVQKPRMKFAPNFRKIIDELESEHISGYSDIILKLLDMSDDARSKFEFMFKSIREKAKKCMSTCESSMVVGENKYGFTVVAGSMNQKEEIYNKLPGFTKFRRQEKNTKSWIGLITFINEQNLIHGWVLLTLVIMSAFL